MGSILLGGLPCLASVGEEVTNLAETWSAMVGRGYIGGPHQLTGEGDGEWGRILGGGYQSGQWVGFNWISKKLN